MSTEEVKNAMDWTIMTLLGLMLPMPSRQNEEKNDIPQYEEWKNHYNCRERYIWDRAKMKFIDKDFYDKEN